MQMPIERLLDQLKEVAIKSESYDQLMAGLSKLLLNDQEWIAEQRKQSLDSTKPQLNYWGQEAIYRELSRIEDLFGNNSRHRVLKAIQKRMIELLWNLDGTKGPNPVLIDSMASRYRHDFGMLDSAEQESIRVTMRQLWEEVVGLGFYKGDVFETK